VFVLLALSRLAESLALKKDLKIAQPANTQAFSVVVSLVAATVLSVLKTMVLAQSARTPIS